MATVRVILVTDDCHRCAQLAAELNRTRQEVKRLEAVLGAIWEYAKAVTNTTGAVLGKRSGVPRGKWSYCKGAHRVGAHVKRLVGG